MSNGERGRRGRGTLADALPAGVVERLERLKEQLRIKAESAVRAQLQRPRAPWQTTTLREPQSAKNLRPTTPQGGVGIARGAVGKAPRAAVPAKRSGPQPPARPVAVPPPPFQFWKLPSEASIRELPPTTIDEKARKDFADLQTAGSKESSSPQATDIFGTIGLDFGTSATKVLVRFPYETGSPVFAIPAPPFCLSSGAAYLWRTCLWMRADGEFVGWPEPGARVFDSLKQGIVLGPADSVVATAADGRTVTRSQAAAAFLAIVIRHARGWLAQNRPQLFQNRRPTWFVNVGLPAAKADDPALVSAYRRVTVAGLLAANLEGPITIDTTSSLLEDPHVVQTAASRANSEALGVAVVPEAAAEASGFAKSLDRSSGVYLLVDVGAMTLDVCTFRLWWPRPTSGDLYVLLTAQVHPLGVEAFHWFSAQGRSSDEFKAQCERSLHEVVWHTKRHRAPREAWLDAGNDLPVFLAGGGAANVMHKDLVAAVGPWLSKHTGNDGIRILDLPVPDNIDPPMPTADFARMAVALGLSYPPTEIGDIKLPSEVMDIPPPPLREGKPIISKDQV